jgi:threonyl-tRNA synthetase
MLIVGEKETKENLLSVREQGKGDLGQFKTNDFVKLINDKINSDFKELII